MAGRDTVGPGLAWFGAVRRGLAGLGKALAFNGGSLSRRCCIPWQGGIHASMMGFKITIVGTQHLLMHNARLSDPLDPYAKRLKEIVDKRNKTDEEHREMARREWAGAVYYDPEMGPYLPGANIERMLLDAARLSRDGKVIERGLYVPTEVNPLQYNGPRDIKSLINNEEYRFRASIKVGRQRVMRCRPRFAEWAVEAEGHFDEEVITPDKLPMFAERGGRLIGLGDWRPRYGRFTASVESWEIT